MTFALRVRGNAPDIFMTRIANALARSFSSLCLSIVIDWQKAHLSTCSRFPDLHPEPIPSNRSWTLAARPITGSPDHPITRFLMFLSKSQYPYLLDQKY